MREPITCFVNTNLNYQKKCKHYKYICFLDKFAVDIQKRSKIKKKKKKNQYIYLTAKDPNLENKKYENYLDESFCNFHIDFGE